MPLASPARRRQLIRCAGAALATLAAPRLLRAQSAPRVTLRFSSSMVADQNAAHFVWHENLLAQLKAAGLGDAVRIDYFPNNQLGKESDVVQQVKVGSVDMMVSGSSIFATICPELGMLDLGYLFDDYAHVARAMDGASGKALNEMLNKASGCSILTWASHFSARSVYTKAPVRSLAEIKGVKLRVLPTPAFIETFKAMGAIPTPIPFGELYMAAQTGVVDGFEHDAATVLASKLDEVVKSCWLTEHLFSPMVVVIGRRGMDKIPADLRAPFAAAVAGATQKQRAIAGDKGKAAVEELRRKGLAFHPMSAADRGSVRKLMEGGLWAGFAKQYPVTAPLFAAIQQARA
jgi:tripartite ATP-independent transporter DctP family solute receptor